MGLAALALAVAAYAAWALRRSIRTGHLEPLSSGNGFDRSAHPTSFKITVAGYVVLIVMMLGLAAASLVS